MHRIVPPSPPKRPAPGIELAQPTTTRSAKVLSLLLILEALRQSSHAFDAQKV